MSKPNNYGYSQTYESRINTSPPPGYQIVDGGQYSRQSMNPNQNTAVRIRMTDDNNYREVLTDSIGQQQQLYNQRIVHQQQIINQTLQNGGISVPTGQDQAFLQQQSNPYQSKVISVPSNQVYGATSNLINDGSASVYIQKFPVDGQYTQISNVNPVLSQSRTLMKQNQNSTQGADPNIAGYQIFNNDGTETFIPNPNYNGNWQNVEKKLGYSDVIQNQMQQQSNVIQPNNNNNNINRNIHSVTKSYNLINLQQVQKDEEYNAQLDMNSQVRRKSMTNQPSNLYTNSDAQSPAKESPQTIQLNLPIPQNNNNNNLLDQFNFLSPVKDGGQDQSPQLAQLEKQMQILINQNDQLMIENDQLCDLINKKMPQLPPNHIVNVEYEKRIFILNDENQQLKIDLQNFQTENSLWRQRCNELEKRPRAPGGVAPGPGIMNDESIKKFTNDLQIKVNLLINENDKLTNALQELQNSKAAAPTAPINNQTPSDASKDLANNAIQIENERLNALIRAHNQEMELWKRKYEELEQQLGIVMNNDGKIQDYKMRMEDLEMKIKLLIEENERLMENSTTRSESSSAAPLNPPINSSNLYNQYNVPKPLNNLNYPTMSTLINNNSVSNNNSNSNPSSLKKSLNTNPNNKSITQNSAELETQIKLLMGENSKLEKKLDQWKIKSEQLHQDFNDRSYTKERDEKQ